MPLTDKTREAAARLVARYPMSRSALLPLLHLVQADQGYVTEEGIAFCAEQLGLTKAEVGAVATFYTMFKREPVGDWLLSVCTNPVCKIAGGQEIYEGYRERCGGGHHNEERTITVEHAECLGICDGAPIVQVNYEMYGPLSVDEAMALFDACAKGDPPPSNWSKEKPGTFRDVEWDLSGAGDGTDEWLIAAARAQAAAEVPPAKRSGETDIPVTHPGGDPKGVGGALFREQLRGQDVDVPPPSTEAPDSVRVEDQAMVGAAAPEAAGPGEQSAPDIADTSRPDTVAHERVEAAEGADTAARPTQDQPEVGAGAEREEPAGTMTPTDASEPADQDERPEPTDPNEGTSPPGDQMQSDQEGKA